jgi:hypothetical protein
LRWRFRQRRTRLRVCARISSIGGRSPTDAAQCLDVGFDGPGEDDVVDAAARVENDPLLDERVEPALCLLEDSVASRPLARQPYEDIGPPTLISSPSDSGMGMSGRSFMRGLVVKCNARTFTAHVT